MIKSDFNYTKALIVGPCCSGKSYFARELASFTGLPLYHLDLMFWKEGWVETPREEFSNAIKEVTKTDKWIIDGSYTSTLEERYPLADVVFFFDFDVEECVKIEKERRGKKRPDLPDYLEEKYDPSFVDFIRNFTNRGRVKILDIMNKYPKIKVITFKCREDKETWIKQTFTD